MVSRVQTPLRLSGQCEWEKKILPQAVVMYYFKQEAMMVTSTVPPVKGLHLLLCRPGVASVSSTLYSVAAAWSLGSTLFLCICLCNMGLRCILSPYFRQSAQGYQYLQSICNMLLKLSRLRRFVWYHRKPRYVRKLQRCRVIWGTSWVVCCFFNAGNGISVEGALLTEQDVSHPKPAKRARTSFTADQLQVDIGDVCLILKLFPHRRQS